jgi:hypothetical protein
MRQGGAGGAGAGAGAPVNVAGGGGSGDEDHDIHFDLGGIDEWDADFDTSATDIDAWDKAVNYFRRTVESDHFDWPDSSGPSQLPLPQVLSMQLCGHLYAHQY